ncbi:MAG: hypothetical protein CME62_08860 [Halobacteriovoraceae bacterium]|nr:hypothetical protein [Halobacteriovoraceae bacterium]
MSEQVLKLVLEVVNEIGEDQDIPELANAKENVRLLGEHLDSMGTVFLITELEAKISDDLNIEVALADERAMSQKTSPFRSVITLTKYISQLLEEQKES